MKRLNEFMKEHFGPSWQLGLLLIAAAAVVSAVAVYEELIVPLLEHVLTPH